MNSYNNGLALIASFVIMGSFVSGCSKDSPAPEVPPTFIETLPQARGLTPELQQADAAFESAHYFMANSTRDPHWHAVVASELHNYPSLTEEINDTCTRCHAPMANDYAKKEGKSLQIFDSGSEEDGDLVQGIYSMDSSHEMFNHAMDGVSCSLCHQIADDGNLGTDEGMSGGWKVNAFPEANFQDRPAYGQYADPDQGYMRQQSGYTPVYGAHISSSDTCGSCHNLKTEPVDKNGEPVPGVAHFAEQMVYTEWENSVFDDAGSQPTSCQSCHMPKTLQPVPLASAGGNMARPDFAEHTFLGANTVMQDMLKNFKQELGVSSDISDADFDESIARNRAFLKTSALIELENTQLVDDKIEMDVKITNLTGHKLPSGYHSRRAYLHVIVTDADGKLVYENGLIRADGSIVGVSEDASPDSYEKHHDTITSATQVQVYQGITGDASGHQTHSLLAATHFLKDNRLTPAGFDKNTVPEDVAVTGNAATDDDFNNGQDIVTYEIAVTGKAPYSTLVELRYQPLAFGSLMSLFAESEDIDQVDMFRTIYDSTTLRDEVIATATTQVE